MKPMRRLLGRLSALAPDRADLPPERFSDLKKLCRILGIRPHDYGLLNQALTHRSYVHERDMGRAESNERMEFLGDSVLGLLVNEHLYGRFEARQEGRLTKIKSLVVSEPILSKVADEVSLGDYILLSDNERQSGGATRASITSDALEAVIAAIYLDSGLEATRGFVESHLLTRIDELLNTDEYRNFKSMIQEHAQRKYGARPRYRVVSAQGPEHARTFFVEIRLKGRSLGRGEGRNKKEAEQMAARNALAKLGLVKENKKRRRGRRSRKKPRRRPAKAAADKER